MTNKEKLNNAIEQDINPKDCYNAIIKKIEEGKKMKNKSHIWKFILAPICSIFIISGILFLNNQNKNTLKNDNYVDEKNDVYLEINNVNIKQTIADIAGSAIDLTFEELINEEGFIADIKILPSLNNYRLMKRYDINDEFIGYNLIYHNTDYQAYKEIDIFFSKTLKNKPSCYGTIDLDKLEDSKINNTKVKILKTDTNHYHALFNYNNYNFDITTVNITEQELSTLLLSIIK
ncbi:MAG: hypothetical protein HFI86_06690 [Bacilli bacterium]|nr:hypothetical protein [Bacilli bacterium]